MPEDPKTPQKNVQKNPQKGSQISESKMPKASNTSEPGEGSPERVRDEAREGGGPRYGGGPWRVADERGDQRFGHARNDDADPSELARGEAENDDDESPTAVDPDLAAAEQAGEIESGGQRAGMSRGEKPRKPKDRES
jgi:hypothetical protein